VRSFNSNRYQPKTARKLGGETFLAVASFGAMVVLFVLMTGCSFNLLSVKDEKDDRPIENPFVDAQWLKHRKQDRVIFRSRRGAGALEVELPGSKTPFTDFKVPMSHALRDAMAAAPKQRGPASLGTQALDQRYSEQTLTRTDHEILAGMPKGSPADDRERQKIEEGLGLRPVENNGTRAGKSYLAAVDQVKQLFSTGRYEAALIETDHMLRAYPTDPKLYEMRGTLLDRLGYHRLAVRAWQQALKLDPQNRSLSKYLKKKVDRANWRKTASE